MPAGSLAKTLLVPGDGHLLQVFGRLRIKQAPVLVAHGPAQSAGQSQRRPSLLPGKAKRLNRENQDFRREKDFIRVPARRSHINTRDELLPGPGLGCAADLHSAALRLLLDCAGGGGGDGDRAGRRAGSGGPRPSAGVGCRP